MSRTTPLTEHELQGFTTEGLTVDEFTTWAGILARDEDEVPGSFVVEVTIQALATLGGSEVLRILIDAALENNRFIQNAPPRSRIAPSVNKSAKAETLERTCQLDEIVEGLHVVDDSLASILACLQLAPSAPCRCSYGSSHERS